MPKPPAILLFSLTIIVLPVCLADLDVNALAGRVVIGKEPAPAGTQIRIINAETGFSLTTKVDGPNIPPFARSEGRYETGDMPEMSTGDTVMVSVDGYNWNTEISLEAGTTEAYLVIVTFQNIEEDHQPYRLEGAATIGGISGLDLPGAGILSSPLPVDISARLGNLGSLTLDSIGDLSNRAQQRIDKVRDEVQDIAGILSIISSKIRDIIRRLPLTIALTLLAPPSFAGMVFVIYRYRRPDTRVTKEEVKSDARETDVFWDPVG